MNSAELQKEAAKAIRELVDENEKLAQDNELYKECVKLAFELAESGNIENTYEDIIKKANELFEDRDEIPVVRKAIQYNTNYSSIGELEKKASVESNSDARDVFASILSRGY